MIDMDEVCAMADHVGGHPTEVSLSGNMVERFGFFGWDVHVRLTERLFTHFSLTAEARRIIAQLKRKGAKRRTEVTIKLFGTEAAQMVVRSTKDVVGLTPAGEP